MKDWEAGCNTGTPVCFYVSVNLSNHICEFVMLMCNSVWKDICSYLSSSWILYLLFCVRCVHQLMWHSGEGKCDVMSLCVSVCEIRRERVEDGDLNKCHDLDLNNIQSCPLNPILKYHSLRWISSWAKQISSVYKLISCLHLLQNICSSKLTCMRYKDVSKSWDLVFSNGWFFFLLYCLDELQGHCKTELIKWEPYFLWLCLGLYRQWGKIIYCTLLDLEEISAKLSKESQTLANTLECTTAYWLMGSIKQWK